MRSVSKRWIFAALAAAVVSLACATVEMFLARVHLVEASELVRQTFDVELSIAACRIHVREAQVSAADRPTLIALARTDLERIGHDAGDQMIRSVADVLRLTFRESDIIARLGGDEFVALLGNAAPATHDMIVARLTASLDQRNVHASPADGLSLSVGITFFDPKRPLPLPDLMVEADRSMYAHKREQRRVRDRSPRLAGKS